MLPYVATDPKAQANQTLVVLEQLFEKWMEYQILIDPRPFYDPDKDGKATDSNTGQSAYHVLKFTAPNTNDWHLDNKDSTVTGDIVIHRYWPNLTDALGAPVAPDVEMWYASETTRAKAFKKAAAEVDGMIASIKASPLYTAGPKITIYGPTNGIAQEQNNPLYDLIPAMEYVISYNPPLEQCLQRTGFDYPESGYPLRPVVLNSNLTGPLYEYYLGYIPYIDDYADQTDHFAFPGTPSKPLNP
ncbi:hypothetical protein FACS189483_06990 [Spirochaetia bacterium]|nr:hypothetical protein FACS189483_06990 [Spirochaetia bacterium]